MRLPNAYSSKSINLNTTEAKNFREKILKATKSLIDYRAKEGLEMEKDFKEKISLIKKLLTKIKKVETCST